MKKLLTILLLSTSPVYAGLISHTDYTSGSVISASGQNTNENLIFNEFNGNIDATNLKAGAVTSSKLDSSVSSQFVPSGALFAWAGSTNSVPSGYLYCDGSAQNRTTYAALFSAIGTAFGNGNGSTTFNLPDLRGKFMRGANDSTGNDPDAASRTACVSGGNTGDKVGSCQADQFKSHTHTVTITDPGHSHTEKMSNGAGSNFSVPQQVATNAIQDAQTTTASATTGITATANASTGGNESRGINVSFGFIIKT